MIKRTLMTLGLGLGLLSGVSASAHASSRLVAYPAVVTADLVATYTGVQTADSDPNAPCATDPTTGAETGDCQNSQNTAGPEDSSGATGESGTSGSDGDNVQQGDQIGQTGTPTPGQ